MKLPILYTMSWPERVRTSEQAFPQLDLIKMGDLTFKEPDRKKYPSLDLAYGAGRAGGTMTGVLSAANEKVGPCPACSVNHNFPPQSNLLWGAFGNKSHLTYSPC